MTLEELLSASTGRLPTADELLDFVRAQKWPVIQRKGKPPVVLLRGLADPVAVVLRL